MSIRIIKCFQIIISLARLNAFDFGTAKRGVFLLETDWLFEGR